MKTLRLALAANVVAAFLGLTLMAHSSPGTAASAACDRECLNGVAEKYIAAMLAHDPSKAPLAKKARYTENGIELPLPDGLWRTVQSIGPYRLFVTDPKEGSVGFFIKAMENGTTVLVSTRLKVVRGQITEMESYAARLSNTVGGAQAALLGPEVLGDSPRKQFLTTIPQEQRLSRDKLSSIANSYFTGLENNTGDEVPPFADDCFRLENGSATTGRPVPAEGTPGPLNYGCREAFALGYYREDTRLRNRRILAVDEERGLVMAGVFFDHDAVLRSYQIKDGRTVTVRNTAPWTWGIHEIFQITPEGKISQVEAILLSVPYGARPGFSTGVHMPSPQALKDGFKEY
jgi:hypothetical protein